MPQVIPAVVAWLGTTVTVSTLSGVALFTVSYGTLIEAALIAGSIAYSSAENRRLRNQLSNLSADRGRDVMARDPLAYRRLIYGQIRTTGPILYMATEGVKNENLHLVVALASHECDDLGEITVDNDEMVPLDGSGNATGKYAGYITVKKFVGTTTQAASPELQAAFPGVWTANHNLFGIAYLHIKVKYSIDLFPNGLPVFKCLVRGKKLWDPRINPSDTTIRSWSSNSALCAGDFLNDSAFGRGVAWSRINTSALIEAANTCDEAVGLAGAITRTCDIDISNKLIGMTTQALAQLDGLVVGMRVNASGVPSSARIDSINNTGPYFFSIDIDPTATNYSTSVIFGDTENRYETHGTITSDQLVDSALIDLCGAMAGHVTDTGGVWVIRAGAYRTPTVDLDESHMIGPISMTPRTSRRDNYNGVKGTYISPFNKWVASDFPAVKNDTYMSWDGGIRLWKDIVLPFTISPSAAQRLAKIDLERGRQQISVEQTFKLHAFECMCFDTVRITKTELGWSNKEFEVSGWKFMVIRDGENVTVGVTLTLRETASAVWDWVDGSETTVDLASNTNLPNPSVVPTPSSLTLLADDTTAFIQADGTFVPRLQVVWPLPGDIYIEQGGHTEEEYKIHASSTWLPWGDPNAAFLTDYITDVKSGDVIDVRIRYRNQHGVRGAYKDSLTDYPSGYTIPTKAALPSTVTGLSASPLPEGILIQWTVPTITAIEAIEVYELGSSSPAPSSGTTATFVIGANATSIARLGLTTGSTLYYWVRVRDTSKLLSTWAGPVNSTAGIGVTSVLATANGKNKVFYQTTAPASGMSANDEWYDTDDQYKLYVYSGSAWVASFAPMLTLDGSNNVTGLQLASGTTRDWVMVASKFQVWDGASPYVPFEIVGGQVRIKDALIQTVDAGKINAGTISVALSLTAASISSSSIIDVGSGASRSRIDGTKITFGYGNADYTELGTTGGFNYLQMITGSGLINLDLNSGLNIRPVTNVKTFGTRINGTHSFDKFVIKSDGSLNWSPGSGSSFDVTLYRNAAGELKTDTQFTALSLSTPYFETGITSASDFKNANSRWYSGGTQTARVDYTNGDFYNQSNRVLSARKTGWGTAPTDGVRNALTSGSSQSDHNDALRQLIADLHQSSGHGMIGT